MSNCLINRSVLLKMNLFNRFKMPAAYQAARKRNYIYAEEDFAACDVFFWKQPMPMPDAQSRDLNEKAMVKELQEEYASEKHLLVFASDLGGDMYCWDTSRPTRDGSDFVVCRYSVEPEDFAPSFPDSIFRMVLHAYDEPVEDIFTEEEDNWTKWHEQMLMAVTNICSPEQARKIREIASRPNAGVSSVYHEDELKQIITEFFDEGYTS